MKKSNRLYPPKPREKNLTPGRPRQRPDPVPLSTAKLVPLPATAPTGEGNSKSRKKPSFRSQLTEDQKKVYDDIVARHMNGLTDTKGHKINAYKKAQA